MIVICSDFTIREREREREMREKVIEKVIEKEREKEREKENRGMLFTWISLLKSCIQVTRGKKQSYQWLIYIINVIINEVHAYWCPKWKAENYCLDMLKIKIVAIIVSNNVLSFFLFSLSILNTHSLTNSFSAFTLFYLLFLK